MKNEANSRVPETHGAPGILRAGIAFLFLADRLTVRLTISGRVPQQALVAVGEQQWNVVSEIAPMSRAWDRRPVYGRIHVQDFTAMGMGSGKAVLHRGSDSEC